MTRIITAVCFVLLFSGCKKTIQKAQEDLVISAMTNGQWAITSFIQNGTDITSDFTTYKFQYYKNRTVDAIKSGVVEKTGNWNGDASAMTTYANFSGVTNPLLLINGTWHIDDNSWTYVKASQSNGSETKIMRLDKL